MKKAGTRFFTWNVRLAILTTASVVGLAVACGFILFFFTQRFELSVAQLPLAPPSEDRPVPVIPAPDPSVVQEPLEPPVGFPAASAPPVLPSSAPAGDDLSEAKPQGVVSKTNMPPTEGGRTIVFKQPPSAEVPPVTEGGFPAASAPEPPSAPGLLPQAISSQVIHVNPPVQGAPESEASDENAPAHDLPTEKPAAAQISTSAHRLEY